MHEISDLTWKDKLDELHVEHARKHIRRVLAENKNPCPVCGQVKCQKGVWPGADCEYPPVACMKHAKGNLLDMAAAGQFDIIVHGCNCFCTMGAGIALEIKERYPEAWAVDYHTRKGDISKLGTFTMAQPENFIIINAYTQYDISKKGEDVFEYSSFGVILKKLAHEYSTMRFGFPYIGMGLAKGNKEAILNQLESFAKEISPKGGTATLVEYERKLDENP